MKKPQMKEETRNKWENFWYYYKIHVIAGVFVLFMLVVFIKDMMSKVDYDYTIGFVTDYIMAEEDSNALQQFFESNGEDLNGDGEVHVQIMDYTIPSEDSQGFDPQMLAASQTKFTVDIQEGSSMLFFLSEENFEKFKDMGVFPLAKEEYVKVSECAGYAEINNPASISNMIVAMRSLEGSKLETKEESVAYYDASERLMEKFVSGSGK